MTSWSLEQVSRAQFARVWLYTSDQSLRSGWRPQAERELLGTLVGEVGGLDVHVDDVVYEEAADDQVDGRVKLEACWRPQTHEVEYADEDGVQTRVHPGSPTELMTLFVETGPAMLETELYVCGGWNPETRRWIYVRR